MKSHLWEAAILSSVCTQVCHPIPLHFPSCFCTKYSAVTMHVRNILGLLSKCFLVVAGCIICYSSFMSRSAIELHFLPQTGVIVRHLEVAVGEHTAQKPLDNCCWDCACGWGWGLVMALLSGCSHTQHQAGPWCRCLQQLHGTGVSCSSMEQVSPDSSMEPVSPAAPWNRCLQQLHGTGVSRQLSQCSWWLCMPAGEKALSI